MKVTYVLRQTTFLVALLHVLHDISQLCCKASETACQGSVWNQGEPERVPEGCDLESGDDASVTYTWTGAGFRASCGLVDSVIIGNLRPWTSLCDSQSGQGEHPCVIDRALPNKDKFNIVLGSQAFTISWTVIEFKKIRVNGIQCRISHDNKNVYWSTKFDYPASEEAPPTSAPTAGTPQITFDFDGVKFDDSKACLIADLDIWSTTGTLTFPDDASRSDFDSTVQINGFNTICLIDLNECTQAAPSSPHCMCTGVTDSKVYQLSIQQKLDYRDSERTAHAYYRGLQYLTSFHEVRQHIGDLPKTYLPANATYKINMKNEQVLQGTQTVTVTSAVKVTFCVANLLTNTKTLDGSSDGATEDGDCITKQYAPGSKATFSYQESDPCQRTASFTLNIKGKPKTTKSPSKGKTTKSSASIIGLSWFVVAAGAVTVASGWCSDVIA